MGNRPGFGATLTNDPTTIRVTDYEKDGVIDVVMDSAAIDSKKTASGLSQVTGVIIDYVSNDNAVGNGTLSFIFIGTLLNWTAPGDSIGTGVNINAGGAFRIASSTTSKYLNVTVTAASIPGANKTDTIAIASVGTPVTTLRKGMVVGKVTFDGKYKQYDNGSSNGTEVAKGILVDEVNMLDESGTAVATPAVMAFSGFFDQAKIFGLDADAKTDLKLCKFKNDF